MTEDKTILHELYVYSEWKPEPEYTQKPDNLLPENISALWRWFKFFGPKKSLIDSVTAHKEKQQKWHIALGDEGKVIAVLTDNILEIRTKRSEYATIAARTTVSRDSYSQWRKLVWSPDCSFVVVAYGNGIISFFDLTGSNLFNIPIDCSRPGGLECTDNTHAVADIIFMPLRVKDNKWNWEVLVVTYDGKLRGYLVSQTEGYKLHHTFRFPGGVSAVSYCEPHSTLYVAGLPRGAGKDSTSPLSAGITAWRILNDDPFYKLSVISDQFEAQLLNDHFSLYIPYISSKNMAFIIHMEISPDNSKLVCLHCNGDISVWRLPLLKAERRWALAAQPAHALRNPLDEDNRPTKYDPTKYYASDVNWWTNEDIILSRYNGAVSVCNVKDMVNILGKVPEFFKGSPQVTCAYSGTFMILECESNVLPAKKSRSDEGMEVVKVENDVEDSMLELTKELFKTVLYAITDIETFQPKPKRITVVSRVYRLLGVKSTTPKELFSRKIESGSYKEALALAETFNLDSDLVYQQQWRKNPVSTDAIQNYLSKVSKKIWTVHQCVDRLPETMPAAKELLQFGLNLTDENILEEINKEAEEKITDPEEITLEQLNAYTSELLRCRHVMLFYKERLALYEAILRCEKSTYVKEEYHRLRTNSIVNSAIEIAKEGRIEALTCLWPHVKTIPMQLAVLEKLPETINPIEFQHLLPSPLPMKWFEQRSPVKIPQLQQENDWCKKSIFRSIWSSNWSEEMTPEIELPIDMPSSSDDIAKWYNKRARDIEERSGLVSHALTLVTIAKVGGGVQGLEKILFHLQTLDTLIYDINVEGITLKELEKMNTLEICTQLMKMSTEETFVSDIKSYLVPFLKRYEKLTSQSDTCIMWLTQYLESRSAEDLTIILWVLKSPKDFELDVRTHLDLVESCLFAHQRTDQLDKACDLLNTILKESDGTISSQELIRRVKRLEQFVSASTKLAWRGIHTPPCVLRDFSADEKDVHKLLTRLARSLATGTEKPTQQDWEKLLKEILELQSTIFSCINKEKCYEIYASSLLTSGDAATIKLASEVLSCQTDNTNGPHFVPYLRSVELVLNAAKEYFNSSSSLNDPALELARSCLSLISDGNPTIQVELDLINALQIMSSFGLTLLPIQVRLCDRRISLIEECLKSDQNGYLACHKLLMLAKLLRISENDEWAREGRVLELVGEYALRAGPAGAGAASDAGRRLAELQHAPASNLLYLIAGQAHADSNARRRLYAASVAACDPRRIEEILKARLTLGLESLQQMGIAMKENPQLTERWASMEEEFADAITTPVIEKKDLVVPQKSQKKNPLLNLVLETFHNKFLVSETKPALEELDERSVHCQQFYAALYPEQRVSTHHYRYERFALPDVMERSAPVAHSVLNWYYSQNCLDGGLTNKLETEVVQKCAEELLYKDTALSVACMFRSCADVTECVRMLDNAPSETSVCCALYAALVKCNAAELRDNVYLTKPALMASTTLKQKNGSEEQLKLIGECIDRLTRINEVSTVREMGFNINGLLFNADEDYRREIIYRLARSPDKDHVKLALSLASTYKLDTLEVWIQHAATLLTTGQIKPDSLPIGDPSAHQRIKQTLWPEISGTDHKALINFFTLLKCSDEKVPVFGILPAEHIKLLKKAKASSPDLDYKLLVEQPTMDHYLGHVLNVLKPDNVGMVTKFLRTLPPAFKIPASVNTVYTKWLTKYFFSVPPANASSKKWMQQYRQCASFFNKLSREDLVQFVTDTCFSDEAVQRVPAGTRNLMVMQAVDYCQQEQENDSKFNKGDQSWSQVGQDMTRWARFLENFHSTTIQNLIDGSNMPRDEVWISIEKSRGSRSEVVEFLGRAMMKYEFRPSSMLTLLQCLHVTATPQDVFAYMAENCLNTAQDVQTLVNRLMLYSKNGCTFPYELIEALLLKAKEHGLPPHKQIGLLSLSERSTSDDSEDLEDIALFTIQLIQHEWPDHPYSGQLTAEQFLSEVGRREIFSKYAECSDTWQRKKSLVDLLSIWPVVRSGNTKSLQSEHLHTLLTNEAEPSENLALIKLLLRRPVLSEEEVLWLAENAPSNAVFNAAWIVLLSRSEHTYDAIIRLFIKHKQAVLQTEMDDELIKELLDNDLFLKLVATPMFPAVLNYIRNSDLFKDDPANMYTLDWAIDKLLSGNYLAEAGRLRLTTLGVPDTLAGFSHSVKYCKGLFNMD